MSLDEYTYLNSSTNESGACTVIEEYDRSIRKYFAHTSWSHEEYCMLISLFDEWNRISECYKEKQNEVD